MSQQGPLTYDELDKLDKAGKLSDAVRAGQITLIQVQAIDPVTVKIKERKRLLELTKKVELLSVFGSEVQQAKPSKWQEEMAEKAAADPLSFLKKELSAAKSNIQERATLKLNPAEQRKYNPDSGLCQINGLEINLSELKHVVFWSQRSDYGFSILPAQMSALVKATTDYRDALINLEKIIKEIEDQLGQLTLEQGTVLLDRLAAANQIFTQAHGRLLHEMNDTRNKLVRNKGKEHVAGQDAETVAGEGTSYKGLDTLLAHFTAEKLAGKLPDNLFKGQKLFVENTDFSNQFFNYLMLMNSVNEVNQRKHDPAIADYKKVFDKAMYDPVMAEKASEFIHAMGGPQLFKEMAYFGDEDPKKHFGLMREKHFKKALKEAQKSYESLEPAQIKRKPSKGV